MSDTTWTAPNANVKVGSFIKVSLSDAPEFVGTVIEIQDDDNFGASVKMTREGRPEIWVSENRIVAVKA